MRASLGAACSALLASAVSTTIPAIAAEDDKEQSGIEEIVILGSRIEKPDYAYSNPVLSVDSQALRITGTIDVVDYLKDIPALVGSVQRSDVGGTAAIGATGLELLNLRNLGTDRTLVLVDGRRHVAADPGTSSVDVSTIPSDLIQRVEILTGGASAMYGADGVSGVVNFVTKQDFDGVTIHAQGGQSSHSDAGNSLIGITAGKNFDDNRSNLSFAAEMTKFDRLDAKDRSYAGGRKQTEFVYNPQDFQPPDYHDDPTLFDLIPMRNVRLNNSSRAGAVITDYVASPTFDYTPDFNGDDTPWNKGLPLANGLQQGGDGTPLRDLQGDLEPSEERETFNLFAHHQFDSGIRLFGEAKYSTEHTSSHFQPSFDQFLYLAPDYAYTPPNISAAANGNFLLVNRDNFDLGIRGERIERQTFRDVVGLEGELADGIRYNASYTFGVSKIDNHIKNDRLNDRFAAALDAVVDPVTGQVVCRSDLDPTAVPTNIPLQQNVINPGWNDFTPLPGTWAGTFTPGPGSGCTPLDILGENVASNAARRWIMTNTTTRSEISQQDLQAYVTGNTARWFTLPAGPIGVSAGVEYRDEHSSDVPSALDRGGFTFGNVIEPTHGDFQVREAFAEVDVPILSDQPGAKALSVDAAYRVSDYTTVGTVETWKFGTGWEVIDDLRFRGTIARATRAPNIAELYLAPGQTFQSIGDPCDIRAVDSGSSYRKANCAAILGALGIDPTTFVDYVGENSGIRQGNHDLSQESADTRTAGFVLQPRFSPNLSIAVDWYDIKIKDAINTAGAGDNANLCVDLSTIENPYCQLIQRDPNTGEISSFITEPLNVAQYATIGYDFKTDYLVELGGRAGTLAFDLIGNRLSRLSRVDLPNERSYSTMGDAGAPEWQMLFDLTWRRAPFVVDYHVSYFDETRRFSRDWRQSDPDVAAHRYLNFESRFVQGLYAEYAFRDHVTIGAGINNLLNEKPDLGQTSYPNGDVGRSYFAALTIEM